MRPNGSALRIMVQAWGLTILGGAITAALGYGLDLALGQPGWALVLGSMGLCAGAAFAGRQATRAAAFSTTVEPSPPSPATQPTE